MAKLIEHLVLIHSDRYAPVKPREGGVKFFECDQCEFKVLGEIEAQENSSVWSVGVCLHSAKLIDR